MTAAGTPRDLLGVEISAAQARACLERAEFGVLGLTNDGEAYSIPVSFGFDSDLDTLYFLFAFDEDSKKRAFIETTETASFTVVESELPDSWTSVVLTGGISEVSGEEAAAYAALGETASFPAMYTFEDYVDAETAEQSLYQLDVDTVTVRGSPEAERAEAGDTA